MNLINKNWKKVNIIYYKEVFLTKWLKLLLHNINRVNNRYKNMNKQLKKIKLYYNKLKKNCINFITKIEQNY